MKVSNFFYVVSSALGSGWKHVLLYHPLRSLGWVVWPCHSIDSISDLAWCWSLIVPAGLGIIHEPYTHALDPTPYALSPKPYRRWVRCVGGAHRQLTGRPCTTSLNLLTERPGLYRGTSLIRNRHPPLGPPYGPMLSPTVGSSFL